MNRKKFIIYKVLPYPLPSLVYNPSVEENGQGHLTDESEQSYVHTWTWRSHLPIQVPCVWSNTAYTPAGPTHFQGSLSFILHMESGKYLCSAPQEPPWGSGFHEVWAPLLVSSEPIELGPQGQRGGLTPRAHRAEWHNLLSIRLLLHLLAQFEAERQKKLRSHSPLSRQASDTQSYIM